MRFSMLSTQSQVSRERSMAAFVTSEGEGHPRVSMRQSWLV
jgi:hypothetical protein